MSQEKNIKKDLTMRYEGSNNKALTDFDICDLYIRCVEVYVQTSSKADIERRSALVYGKELWKETIKTLKEYRDGQS